MKIVFNNVKAHLVLEDPNEESSFHQIRKDSKIEAPGAKFTKPYYTWKKTKGKEGWDGKVDIYKKNGTFPTGLVPVFLNQYWNKFKLLPTLVDQRTYPAISSSELSQIKLRSYQEEALKLGLRNTFNNLWWPRGIFEQATGAGKTELAVALFQQIQRPTLFIVHLKSLAEQTVGRFAKYGYECGILFDGAESIHPMLNVATIQTLTRGVENEIINKMLLDTEQVIFDEAHLIAANSTKGNWLFDVSEALPNAFFRWGLTATPFKKDVYSNLLLAGCTGNVLHAIKNKELIEKKFLTKAEVKIINVPSVYGCPKKWPNCYDDGIILNKARTDLLVKQMKENKPPMFVFTMREAHAIILETAAIRAGLKIVTLMGKNSLQERKAALKRLEKGEIHAIICTTIFDEGIDFPSLQTVIMGGGGKSEIKTLQRLGRGLRLHESKDVLTIVDFMDRSAPTLKNHSLSREKVYRDQGFKIIYV